MKLTKFVAGFYYYNAYTVLLITKNRPDWQKDKLNAIGGHVEKGETYVQAMRREFREETGVDINESRWIKFAEYYCYEHKGKVIFFLADRLPKDGRPKAATDESIEFYSVFNIPFNAIPNLHWLIPMSTKPYRQYKDWPIIIKETVRKKKK